MASQDMMYVYILRSAKHPKKTYIGITENLVKRLAEHNANTQPHTSRYSPWKIETYIAFTDKNKAFNFEKYLKAGSGKAFLNKHLVGQDHQGLPYEAPGR
jgi:putative endonuclease